MGTALQKSNKEPQEKKKAKEESKFSLKAKARRLSLKELIPLLWGYDRCRKLSFGYKLEN